MKKHWSALVSAGFIAASVMGFQGAAAAAPAGPVAVKAHPTGCSAQIFNPDGQQGATAKCNKSNGGHYKAIVVCKRLLTGELIDREAGVWKSGGSPSIVWCPPESASLTAGFMTKAS
ncbi:hypothetical protein O1Q96_35295 [Streptomyces sp. Qhu-G9]|uniref:hypothetical protein n=1 Tax=Streptomyces sp. Qhu-G9 TaxID=3452799 RepID=UPI0022AC179D|nr:hypothetical protein [Streptomyces aurantiacus]WAU84501.1 hypothetical protein O1Q96_35295 [Streptomyces aurantiacus]